MANSKNKPSVTNEVVSSILGAIPWALGAGGLGALGGYFFTGGDKDEDPKARMQRRLKNALIMGAMGAGIGGGGKMAYDLIGDEKATTTEEINSALGKAGKLALDGVGSDYFMYGGGTVGGGVGGYLGYKSGVKSIDDAVTSLGKLDPAFGTKADILKALEGKDINDVAKGFKGNEDAALKALKTVKGSGLTKGLKIGKGVGLGAGIPILLSWLAGKAGDYEEEARLNGE